MPARRWTRAGLFCRRSERGGPTYVDPFRRLPIIIMHLVGLATKLTRRHCRCWWRIVPRFPLQQWSECLELEHFRRVLRIKGAAHDRACAGQQFFSTAPEG